MGFWKDVDQDTSRGMNVDKAIALNAELRYGNHSIEEKERMVSMAEADMKLDKMQ